MTFEEFSQSLGQSEPPVTIHPIAQALWYDAKGDWEQAHEVAQSREGTQAYDHLHAYLHRKEGDRFNAGYWYRRAGVPVFSGSLDAEWAELVRTYLN
ncbi:hypothetical protein [Spirosoma sp. KUDC1026]|uniref:hypothetical protein n=1 Tax=Spirosoma sp. KUDC1026 TaxID=2745947 RepID=UPI00159B9385|nr:hypothetical protein [Spirosoma sp. KUDC1026]QKZ12912.1 hypothetical protein HU175_09820 [Spirosoma sp. KUDC1026]